MLLLHLHVLHRRVLSLLGMTGAGKSTTLMAILQALPATDYYQPIKDQVYDMLGLIMAPEFEKIRMVSCC